MFSRIRERISGTVAAVIGAICLLAFGAFLAFVISPQQAAEWRRVQNLPELSLSEVQAASSGTLIALTGTLEGNDRLLADGFVAYETKRWDVSPPSDNEDEPDGSWTHVESQIPALTIAYDGGTIATVADNGASVAGNLHEVITDGQGSYSDTYNGRTLRDGALHTQGFFDGDLITVVGKKASSGGIVPDRLFGGDRVQLVDHIKSGARAAFIGGIAMMICSPIVLAGGILSSLFGRRKKGLQVKALG
nr:hypothetical protein [Anaerolineae bacterium]